MNRKLAIICMALAVALSGCGKNAEKQSAGTKGKRTIVFVFKLVGIPYSNVC